MLKPLQILILLLFLISTLPVHAKWLIDPNECNCDMRPINSGRKLVRNLLIPFEKQDAKYELYDTKTSEFLNILKIDENGFYKVKDKWYKAKWQEPAPEELLQNLATYQTSYPRFLPFLYLLSAPALYPHSSSQPLLNPSFPPQVSLDPKWDHEQLHLQYPLIENTLYHDQWHWLNPGVPCDDH